MEYGADHDHANAIGNRRHGGSRIGHDQHVACRKRCQWRVRLGEPEQCCTSVIGGTLGTQRQVRHAGQRYLVSALHRHHARRADMCCDATQQEECLVRQRWRCEHGDMRGTADRRRRLLHRLAPRRRRQCIRRAGDGILESITTVDPAIVHATDIAGEVLVHRGVRTGTDAHHDVVANLQHHIAALRTAWADRCRAIQLPGARAVQKILRQQGADRTEVHHVAGPRMREITALELADVGAVTTFAHVQHGVLRHHVHEAHASCAQDAAIRHVEYVAPEILHRVEAFRLHVARILAALGKRVVLQFALASLVADRAVERMVDQQELQHTLARLARLVRVHMHDLPFTDGRRTCRRQLRKLFHFHETHAADTRHWK